LRTSVFTSRVLFMVISSFLVRPSRQTR
jgi:hypothetical protein